MKDNAYEMESPPPPWVQITGGARSWSTERSYLKRDIVYIRCPESHAIQLVEIGYQGVGPKPGRPLFQEPPFEQLVLDLYTDRRGVLRTSVKQVVGHTLTTVSGRTAVEIEHTSTTERHGFCPSEEGRQTAGLRTKDVVIDSGKSLNLLYLGWRKLLILSYSAPSETFNESLGEFDTLVKTVRFLKEPFGIIRPPPE